MSYIENEKVSPSIYLLKYLAENELLYGKTLYNNKQFDNAINHIEKSVEHSIKSGNKNILIKAYIVEGNMLKRL